MDLPTPDTEPVLRKCVADLSAMGYDAHLFLGDSTDPEIIECVKELCPYDAVFIDANHTYEYVTKDWVSYGSMSRKIVAFHDINHTKPVPPGRKPIEVKRLWDHLKTQYSNLEYCYDDGHNGIGVIFK